MRRREFITILGAAAVGIVMPAKAWPQEPGRKYRLGFLVQTPRGAPHFTAVFDELWSYGFIEGVNLTVTGEFSVTYDRLEAVAVALAKAYPDAIVCGGVATRVVQRLTTAIPILAIVDDMGPLVDSFAHPGGYTTGVSIFATELDGKRQEILIEFLPVLRHIAALADPANTSSARERALQKTALLHGVGLSIYRGDKPEDITVAIEAAQRAGAQALNVLASPILNANRQLIIERVALARLPAIYQWPEAARDGGLLAYGPRFASVYRQLARQVVKVLKGAKPADVPVEQPTKFELVINLKTAKALGLVIPPTLLARTDEVIE